MRLFTFIWGIQFLYLSLSIIQAWGRRRKDVQKKKLIDKSCGSNIKTFWRTYLIRQKISLMRKNGISSTFFQQTVQQIKVIQAVVHSEVSKLNHTVKKKTCHLSSNNILAVDGSCYKIMDSPKFYKKCFYLSENVYDAMEKKQSWDNRKK